MLDPRNTWADKEADDRSGGDLAGRLKKNFAQYEDKVSDNIAAAAPAGR